MSRSQPKLPGWERDTTAESILKRLRHRYVLEIVSLGEVDWKTTEENTGRFGREVNESDVEDYKDAMLDGDVFPAVVGVRGSKGVVILGGVRRTMAALRAGKDSVLCYFVDAQLPSELRWISVLLNRAEGRRMDRKEAIHQGIALVEEGFKGFQLSKQFGERCYLP